MGGFSVTKLNEIIKGVSVERAEKRRMVIPGTLQHSEARKGTEQSGAEIPGTWKGREEHFLAEGSRQVPRKVKWERRAGKWPQDLATGRS